MPLLFEHDGSGTPVITRITFGNEPVSEPPLKESYIKKFFSTLWRMIHGNA
jgi:hypothetical protein